MNVGTLENIAVRNILQNTTVYSVTENGSTYRARDCYAETIGVTLTLDDAKMLMIQECKKYICGDELLEYISEDEIFNEEEIETLIDNGCISDDDFCLDKMDETTKLRFLKGMCIETWGKQRIVIETGDGYRTYSINEMKLYISDT